MDNVNKLQVCIKGAVPIKGVWSEMTQYHADFIII